LRERRGYWRQAGAVGLHPIWEQVGVKAVGVAFGKEQDGLVVDEAGIRGDEVERVGGSRQVGELTSLSGLHVERRELGGVLTPIRVYDLPPVGAEAEGNSPLHAHALKSGDDDEIGIVARRPDPPEPGPIRPYEEEPLLGQLGREAAELTTDDLLVRHLEDHG